MKFQEWKDKYPNAQAYYDGFYNSKDGQESWDLAHEVFLNGLSEEVEEDPIDIACDILINEMENWLLFDVSQDEYEEADKWFDSLREELSEAIYAGLT